MCGGTRAALKLLFPATHVVTMAVALRRVRIRLGVAAFPQLLPGTGKRFRLKTFHAVLGSQGPLLPMVSVASSIRKYSSDSLPPHQILSMPALSPTMNRGTVNRWRKKEGDEVWQLGYCTPGLFDVGKPVSAGNSNAGVRGNVLAGDVLCEIETDKASVDFEAIEEGFLAKILVPAGPKEVDVGSPLCVVVENAKDIQILSSRSYVNASPIDKNSDLSSSMRQSSVHLLSSSFERIGPSVRRLLVETGLNKLKLRGTGPRGLLVKGDVLAALRGDTNKDPANEVGIGAKGVAPELSSTKLKPPTTFPEGPFDQVPTSQIRKIIAKKLLESKNGIPHVYLNTDALLDPMLAIRKKLMDEHGIKLSVNDFVIRAAALALKAVPEANAFWDVSVQEVVANNSIDIAIAVSTDKGLITPVIRDADQKSLSLISAEVKLLSEKARMGKLAPHEFRGGTFSISNLGMYAVNRFCAIINPPQACILAVGRGEKTVIWEESSAGLGKPITVTRMTVTISADMRVFDADIGGRFLRSLLANFSNPRKMLL